MPIYRYKAVDSAGKMVRGMLDAGGESDLEMRLHGMGLATISFAESRLGGSSLSFSRVSRRDVITFCFYLEQQTQAGIPLLDSMRDLRDGTDNRAMRDIVTSMIESIQNGSTLSMALRDHPRVFDEIFVSLVVAGERTGKLGEILKSLTEDLKWQDELIAKAKKVAAYPAFVAVAVFAVIISLMVFLVPELLKFIIGMGKELPIQTRALVFVSDSIRNYGPAIFGVTALVVLVLVVAIQKNMKVRLWWDSFRLKIPVVGVIQQKLILSRFTHNFALMYSAGLTVMEGLEICQGIAGNKVIAGAIEQARQRIMDGQSISASFETTGLFPRFVVRMLRIGETTGALHTSLANIGYFYDRDVKDLLEKMEAAVGPAVTVVLGLVLAWVILSVLGPIYETLGSVKF